MKKAKAGTAKAKDGSIKAADGSAKAADDTAKAKDDSAKAKDGSVKRKPDRRRVIEYSSETGDDFANNNITQTVVDGSFPYIGKSVLCRIAEFIVYYIVALPIVFLMCRIGFGLRIKNRKAIRKVRGSGYFLYGNHTHFSDAYIAPLVAFPKKAFIIANPDAVSIKGIRRLVVMLGCIPIPTERRGMKQFVDAVETRVAQGCCVAIYPEAHIWPFYTHIRPFSANSFHYQAKLAVPGVPMCMTYRNRRLFGLIKLNKPGMTLHIGEPIYPDETLSERENRQRLRDRTYEFMRSVSDGEQQYEHVIYVKKEADEAENESKPA